MAVFVNDCGGQNSNQESINAEGCRVSTPFA